MFWTQRFMIRELDRNCEFCLKVYEIKKADIFVKDKYLCKECLKEFKDLILNDNEQK